MALRPRPRLKGHPIVARYILPGILSSRWFDAQPADIRSADACRQLARHQCHPYHLYRLDGHNGGLIVAARSLESPGSRFENKTECGQAPRGLTAPIRQRKTLNCQGGVANILELLGGAASILGLLPVVALAAFAPFVLGPSVASSSFGEGHDLGMSRRSICDLGGVTRGREERD